MSPIGNLRHRLVIEAEQRSDDGGGGSVVAWALFATVWGDIVPLSGTESVRGERLAGQISHRIILRYSAGVTPAMRIRLGARFFRIKAILDPDERRRWLHCLCEEESGG